jgi:hypothetical protein
MRIHSKRHRVATVVGAGVLTGMALLFARSVPDLVRYFHIEKM